VSSQIRLHDDRPSTAAVACRETTERLKTDDIEYPVDLDLDLVLGDMPQKVWIPWNVDKHLQLRLKDLTFTCFSHWSN